MKLVFLLLIVIVPILMFWLARRIAFLERLFHVLALLSFYSMAAVIAGDVYATNAHNTTFTTDIHHLLLDGWFLFPAAYLGVYAPYLIWMCLRSTGSQR
ncbi:hypothetical protein [Paenibacillus hubeiensis]|uniref:hypothetical protein n=1 Tax=Paenibacillus hubeiensis TaxID=3077330 RepID=UPI0031BAEBDB